MTKYFKRKYIVRLKEVAECRFSPSEPFNEKMQADFDLWFDTWIKGQIESIIEEVQK